MLALSDSVIVQCLCVFVSMCARAPSQYNNFKAALFPLHTWTETCAVLFLSLKHTPFSNAWCCSFYRLKSFFSCRPPSGTHDKCVCVCVFVCECAVSQECIHSLNLNLPLMCNKIISRRGEQTPTPALGQMNASRGILEYLWHYYNQQLSSTHITMTLSASHICFRCQTIIKPEAMFYWSSLVISVYKCDSLLK